MVIVPLRPSCFAFSSMAIPTPTASRTTIFKKPPDTPVRWRSGRELRKSHVHSSSVSFCVSRVVSVRRNHFRHRRGGFSRKALAADVMQITDCLFPTCGRRGISSLRLRARQRRNTISTDRRRPADRPRHRSQPSHCRSMKKRARTAGQRWSPLLVIDSFTKPASLLGHSPPL